MNLRPVLLAAAALATALCISFAFYRWSAQGDGDLWAIARGIQRGEEPDSHFELGWRHNMARRVLAADVVAGRLSLREAAGHFRRLDAGDPGFRAQLLPPPGDDRFYCGRILDFVWEVLPNQQQYAAAARWYAEAFTADPQLLAGPPPSHRYRAACADARAGCGQGQDAADLDDNGRAPFRRQARDWLRAELDSWRRLLEKEPGNAWLVARELRDWLEDPHFAGVRGSEAIGRLPESERQAWQKLWADVADTLARALRTAPPKQQTVSKDQSPEGPVEKGPVRLVAATFPPARHRPRPRSARQLVVLAMQPRRARHARPLGRHGRCSCGHDAHGRRARGADCPGRVVPLRLCSFEEGELS